MAAVSPRGPVVFRVSAYMGGVWGGGTLSISPGALQLDASRATRVFSSVSSVVHRELDVTLVRARFMPPWYDTGLLLSGDGRSGVAITSVVRRRALRAALKQAGFEVNEVATRLSLRGTGAAPLGNDGGNATSRKRRASLAVATVVAGAGALLLVHHYVALVVLVGLGVVATLIALWRDLP